ncbi:uncharacterized protein TRAVEDRAFT_115077 [Trametes versicolor FP-101664 SS1]|uniref:uncharacterized protein n=1 Tax=Trametes versicolor (strain FP-101664) TaxID=717944 RepID=UPI0004622BD7|nr:uncharacterized protein TRAVEDRAFT_115077 [Trametes versicolor FP-101664 SS1]EIW62540.1 hypothetical protein TRAVEDRAFT_115077 [Trametes versicolor FP-101664 SS1]
MPVAEDSPSVLSSNSSGTLEFPSPFTFILNNPVPFVELRLRRFARTIRDKPNWWEKVHDPNIVARWTREVIEHDLTMVEQFWGGERRYDEGAGEKQWPRDPITDAQLAYLFDELRYLASQRDEETGISETTLPMVYESLQLIPPSLKASLKELAERLEDVPEDKKDWHPGSGQQVLDLVHPSLFCLRIGHSLVQGLHSETGDPLRLLTHEEYLHDRLDIQQCHPRDAWYRRTEEPRLPFEYAVSRSYQWLPTDFAVSDSGHVTSQGYINNLNPEQYTAGYCTVSSILKRLLPLFERVIADQLNPPRSPIFPINPLTWYKHPDSVWLKEAPPGTSEVEDWQSRYRWPVIPDVVPFEPPQTEGRAALSLRGRTIQVIVKMANIVLTPENPSYPGGAWHVEGMANEKIVATGLYYYDNANITESQLAFRAAVGDGLSDGGTFLNYEQWDHRGYLAVYGLTNMRALNQELGRIVAREDKCIAFPNIYQHRVAPFELADPTRGGHRKILALFLVDPLTRVHSTSVVPRQQAQWYRDAVYGAKISARLPPELVELILGYVLEGMVTEGEAMVDREELMKERAHFVMTHNQNVFEAEFAMCEH